MRRWALMLILLPAVASAQPTEDALKEAIGLANQGQNQRAIDRLSALSKDNPGDVRILLSLGLVYKTVGNVEESISAFERSVAIKPSEEAYYSLGLLYEAMSVRTAPSNKAWLNQALLSWQRLIDLKPADANKIKTAMRHMDRLNQELQP